MSAIRSIGPVLPSQPTESVGGEPRKMQRSVSEARRLISQNRITGPKALRIINMLAQAEQNMSTGKSTDAERFAREALKLARGEGEPIGAPNPLDQNVEQPNEESSDGETIPASEALGVAPENPFERETTSYTDGSDDGGISFQAAQPLTQSQAPLAVRQHELSHIRRETSEAILNGQRVMASVTIRNRIDPSTGERHVDGGRARVIVFPEIKPHFPTGEKIDRKA